MKKDEALSILKILDKNDLTLTVERLVRTEGMGYAEAIIHTCDQRGIEPEDVAKLISGSLKEKLEAEAQRNNILPKPNRLFGL